MKLVLYFPLFLILFYADLYAQDEKVAEDKILSYLEKLERVENDFDTLDLVNSELMSYLKQLATNQATLLFNFNSLKDKGNVLTSDDKKFRIYCWDTRGGGTMRYYNALIQYKTDGGAHYKVLNNASEHSEPADPWSWYSELHTIRTKDDKTYYVAMSVSVLWSSYHVSHIETYVMEDNKLNDSVKFFYTPGASYNSISVEFDRHQNQGNAAFDENSIHLSPDKQKLYIPIVKDKGLVTDKSLVYKFDGYKFVYDKTAR